MVIRFFAVIGIVSGLALLGWGIVRTTIPPMDGPVYPLETIQNRLAAEPQTWLRREVRLRATPELCPPEVGIEIEGVGCTLTDPVLAQDTATDRVALLPFEQAPASSLLTLLRRLPGLTGVLPAPQKVNWGTEGVFTVRLASAPCPPGEPPPCYVAQLLDAAPSSL